MGKRKVPDLYRAPFPLYSVKVDPKTGWVITAGGGGASRTGIKNAVHFLDFHLVGESQYGASLLHSHDTGTRATMNMALADGVIAAGQDGICCLMQYKRCRQKGGEKPAASDGGHKTQGSARRRALKGDVAAATEDGAQMKDETVQVSVMTTSEVESDLNPEDPLQKVVRFSSDQSLLLTGGTDGHVRIWELPSLKKTTDFKAHKGEIEDLDLSPGKKHLVTVGRDMMCSVWTGDQLAMSLQWQESIPHKAERTYRYMACRFGKVEDQKDALRLYTVQVPHKRERKAPPCYLTKWDGKSFLPMLTAPCGTEVISTLALSDCGTFIGLGTVTGSVSIVIAFSLQRLYYVHESHGIVVTDLTFLPDGLKGTNEAAMLSVAVDSRCQVHAVHKRRSCPIWLLMLFCGLMVVAAVVLLQHLFPGLL